jgi:hypothetical protein
MNVDAQCLQIAALRVEIRNVVITIFAVFIINDKFNLILIKFNHNCYQQLNIPIFYFTIRRLQIIIFIIKLKIKTLF